MKGDEASRDEQAREPLTEGPRARFLPAAAPARVGARDPLNGADEAQDAVDAPADADPRSLLTRLRALDGELGADLELVSGLKDTEREAARAARSPAGSPEEARRTALNARAFLAVNGEPIREAEARIRDLTQERGRLLERMARTGFFRDRWVNDGGRAVYLASFGQAHPAYELHKAPWEWVKDAQPGEDPRETLRRGPVLERRYRRKNQTLLLLAVPFAAYCITAALPPPLPHYSVAFALVAVAVLLVALPLAREALVGRVIPNPGAERRLVEEEAASAQLLLIRRGGRQEEEPPSLDELTEAMLAGLEKPRVERGTVNLITVVEDPEDRTPRAPSPDDAPSGDEDAR